MKKILALVTVAVAVSALGGCSSIQWRKKKAPKPVPAAAMTTATPASATAAGKAAAPAIRVGTSSATVERMAQEQGCIGGPGAGLVGEPGPVEVYRMQCADGRVFSARCELRQCKKM